MNADDLAALATQLLEGAVTLAQQQGQVEPGALAAHVAAVQERRRVVAVDCRISGQRLAISCWTEPADCRGEPERFPLLLHQHRLREGSKP